MRPRVTMVLAIVAVLIGGAMLVPAAYARLSGGDALAGIGGIGGGAQHVPAPAPTTPPPPTLAAGPVSVNFKGEFFSWALLDRETGKISRRQEHDRDQLDRVDDQGVDRLGLPAPARRQARRQRRGRSRPSTAIRDSNDDAAERRSTSAGGRQAGTRTG